MVTLAQRQDRKAWMSFRLLAIFQVGSKTFRWQVEVLVALGGTWLYLKGTELSLHHSQCQRESRWKEHQISDTYFLRSECSSANKTLCASYCTSCGGCSWWCSPGCCCSNGHQTFKARKASRAKTDTGHGGCEATNSWGIALLGLLKAFLLLFMYYIASRSQIDEMC